LNNKTRSLQKLAQSVVNAAAVPHIQRIGLSFNPVYDVIDIVIACTTVTNTSSIICPYTPSLRSLYDTVAKLANKDLANLAAAFRHAQSNFYTWVDQLTAIMVIVNNFYNSVMGAQGIIAYISKNSGLGNLCGKSSPNFCTFVPVQFNPFILVISLIRMY
jgi:hypothetical protein